MQRYLVNHLHTSSIVGGLKLNSPLLGALNHMKFTKQGTLLNNYEVRTIRNSVKRSVGIVGMPNVGKSTLFNGTF